MRLWCVVFLSVLLVRFAILKKMHIPALLAFAAPWQNVLEDRLRHSNSAVVLSATKVFLHYTRHLSRVHMSVYERLKGSFSFLCNCSAFGHIVFKC